MPEIQTEIINEVTNVEPHQPEFDAQDFHPINYPSLALQTYESFGGDSNRSDNKNKFSSGQSTHLKMDYPRLAETTQFDEMTNELNDRLELAIATFGLESATVSSIKYRLEEVEFLRAAHTLNNPKSPEDRQQAASDFVAMSERLYGKPDQELAGSILGTFKQNSDLDNPFISELWRQIEEGFSVTLPNGEVINVDAVTVPTDFKELPKLSKEAELMLDKEWRLFRGPLVEAQALMAENIALKQGKGPDYDKREIVFTGPQLYSAFVLGSLGLSETMDIPEFNVVLDPDGSAASWESGQQAVVIGAKRSAEMGASRTVTGIMPHEATHAVKSLQGVMSGEPALSTGVFTQDEHGNWISYLDYEEGNNRLGEKILKGDDESIIKISELHDYTLIPALAYRGFDDRQIKEVMKKIATAVRLSDNRDIDATLIEEEIKNDFTTPVERFFRGTPCDPTLLVDGHIPIFTKDTAYDRGELLIAIPYWNRIVEEAMQTPKPQEYLHREFIRQNKGKIDPSDPRQSALIAA